MVAVAPRQCTEAEAGSSGIHPVVLVRDCVSADWLYHAFDPIQPQWRPSRASWIFRGHGDAEWSLVPTAYRARSWEGHRGFDKLRRVPSPGVSTDLVFDPARERDLIGDFLQLVDAAGLPVPHNNVDHREYRARDMFAGDWEPEQIPLVALAQHHGLPTRLLDWSRQPRIAAYFAAVTSCQGSASHLAVWALRTDFLEKKAALAGPQVEIATAPRASNPNLHAQAGVFTLEKGSSGPKPIDWVVFEQCEHLRKANDKWPHEEQNWMPLLIKMVLRREHAPRLLELLAWDGVTAASIFPGYRGVADSLRERELWRKDDHGP